ncbi:MAG: hypothetical protein ABJC98_05185 [Bacteroidota bacterium]
MKIHPWNDGNGKKDRLLEKWFLARKLRPRVLFIQSEKMYYRQYQTNYRNIRALGLAYEELKYIDALSFLKAIYNDTFYGSRKSHTLSCGQTKFYYTFILYKSMAAAGACFMENIA